MPETNKRSYAGEGRPDRKTPVTGAGPTTSPSGPTRWANPSKTRGHTASGRSLRNCESTYGAKTKLTSLKRGR